MNRLLLLVLVLTCVIYMTDSSMQSPISQYAKSYSSNHLSRHNDNEQAEAEFVINNARTNVIQFYIYLRNKFIQNTPENEEKVEGYREFRRNLAQDLSRFDYTNYDNEGLKRQIKRLSKLQLNGLPSKEYRQATDILKSLQELITDVNIPPINGNGPRLRYQPNALDRIRNSLDQEVLLHLWREWRNSIGKSARNNLISYKDYYRKAATLNGHITPSKTWYLYYDDDNMLDQLTKFMEGLKPLYEELHAYMRHSIRGTYEDVPYDGPIPHHLMEQIMEQEWHKNSAFKVPHVNYQLPNLNEVVQERVSSSESMLTTAMHFYELGLGLPPFEEHNKQFFMPLYTTDPDCKAIVEKFPPDYGIKYCPKINYKRYLQLLQAVGKLKYYQQIVNLPLGLDEEACPGFSDAIGEAVVIAAGSPKFIDSNFEIKRDTYTVQLQLNRLFRMAVHTIFSITQYFIHEKWWADFLDGKITEENMNCEFWRLQEEWAGVAPPEDRDESTFDASYKFYKGISDETSSTKHLMSEMLGYQFYKSFCMENIGHDQDYTLSNCNIYDNKRAGEAMIKMMNQGSIKDWHEMLFIMTNSTKLDPTPMIEYYEPLHDWLMNENKKYAIHVGWDIEMDECDN